MLFKNIFYKGRQSKISEGERNTSLFLNEVVHERGNAESIYPSDFSHAEVALIEKVRPYTMTSLPRLVSLLRATEYIVQNRIEGAFVECGVWKGGSMMLVAYELLLLGVENRKLYLFDTFEGMSEPTEVDKTFDNIYAKELLENEKHKIQGNNIWCYSTIDEVTNNMLSTGYDQSNMTFIKGKVEDTLPYKGIDKISLLRLDTDWYESTRHELENLFDRLVIGGIIIIDDYGHWSGAKKAVDEFIKAKQLTLFLNRIDYTCRLGVKIN